MMTLSKHLPRGQWWIAPRFQELMTARAWNRIPSAWDRLGKEDKAEMMALEYAEAIMRQWDSLSKEELASMRFEQAEQSDG